MRPRSGSTGLASRLLHRSSGEFTGRGTNRTCAVAAIADAENKLKGVGRLVIRKSGTEPVIRVMAEGDDADLVTEVVDSICDEIEAL